MNSFGLNSAALNGGISKFVMAGALLAATAAFAADAERITYGIAQPVASVSTFEAEGTRTALSGAQSDASAVITANGVIAITTSARVNVTSSFKAAHTLARAGVSFEGGASAHIIKGGAARFDSSWTATAQADRTAYALYAEGAATSHFSRADASVQRSGQQTRECDGYTLPATTSAGFAAAGQRIALSFAVFEIAAEAAPGKATQIHGAGARFECALSADALAASDQAYAGGTSDMSAIAAIMHSAVVELSESCSDFAAEAVAMRFATPAPIEARSAFTAEARIAQIGAAAMVGSMHIVAVGRMAELGAASTHFTSGAAAAPWVYRPSAATCGIVWSAQAEGHYLIYADATIEAHTKFSALAIANPTTRAPASRTMRVPAQNRSMRVPYQNRTMRVQA